MTSSRRSRLVAASIAGTATVFMCLAALGRDPDRLYMRASSCADLNFDTDKGEMSSEECVKDSPCVFCYTVPAQPTGDYVRNIGKGAKMHMPVPVVTCTGDKLIGVCTGDGGVSNCDISTAQPKGKCSGTLYIYQPQPTDPKP